MEKIVLNEGQYVEWDVEQGIPIGAGFVRGMATMKINSTRSFEFPVVGRMVIVEPIRHVNGYSCILIPEVLLELKESPWKS